MTTSFTTGPIYVDPPVRIGEFAFGLLISLFLGEPSVTIESIELYGAPNSGFDTPETWTRILLVDKMKLDNNKMINIVEEVRSGFPYYQWVINYQTEVQVNGVTHSLYLLNKNYQSISNAPLIANGDWTLIPTLV